MRLEKWIYTMPLRLRSLFRRERADHELDEELRDHVERKTRELVVSGMTAQEARRAALLEMGGMERRKEECRETRRVNLVQDALQDLRYAVRVLRKSPGFTAVAILSLALGIGANTAIFSLIDAILLRDLPVRNPSQLVELMPANRTGDNAEMSLVTLEQLNHRQDVFSCIFGWWGDGIVNAEIRGVYQRVDIYAVDGNFYSQLGASPLLGRFITPGDVNLHSGAPAQVAVLGYDFWRSQFGGDPFVVGKTIHIETVPFDVIGVSREGFTGLSASNQPQITIPLTAEPILVGEAADRVYQRSWQALDVTARLKDGITMERANAEMQALWPSVQTETVPPDYSPSERRDFLSNRLVVKAAGKGFTPLHKRFVEPLYLLLGIAGLVLLIACVNLASLLTSRAAARSQEIAVRVALGAGRARLLRQLLTESLMLSVAGAVLGFAFAWEGSHALADFVLNNIFVIPARLNLRPDWRVLGFTAAAGICTGIFFGLAPALGAVRNSLSNSLHESSRTATRGGRSGKFLVCAQIALSLALLMCASLFMRSFGKLRSRNPGFRTDGVLLAGLFARPNGYKGLDDSAYYRELSDRLNALPGVVSAGISNSPPAVAYDWKVPVAAGTADAARSSFDADLEMFSPGVFRTLGIKLEQGRDFSWADNQHAPRVAIISESLAKNLFPGRDAVGRPVTIGANGYFPFAQRTLLVVGIVSEASFQNVRERYSPDLYIPALQGFIEWGDIVVRTNRDPLSLIPDVRQVVDSMGHEYLLEPRTLSDHIERSLLQERVTAIFSAFFGGLALLLASIGVYGLMSHTITRRTREIGIRMALGAQKASVLSMILRETVALILAGIVIGIPCALLATDLIANYLFGLSPRDPLTFVIVASALLVVGAVAGYIPALRAVNVDALVALRYE